MHVARHPRSEMLTAINRPLSAVETLRPAQGECCAGPAAADEGRLDEAKAALEHSLASSELFGAPLLVVANKQVQRQAMPCIAAECYIVQANCSRAQGFLRLLRQFRADIDVCGIDCSLDTDATIQVLPATVSTGAVGAKSIPPCLNAVCPPPRGHHGPVVVGNGARYWHGF